MNRFNRPLWAVLWAMIWVSLLGAEPVTITNAVVGSGIVVGTGTYESGTTATLRAVPQVDWAFDHWEGVSAGQRESNPLETVVTTGLQPKAMFIPAAGVGRFRGGTVVAWQSDSVGHTQIPAGLNDVMAISVGATHSLALRSGGLVVGWGHGLYGGVPGNLSNVVAIAAGDSYSIALLANGTVRGWGDSYVHQEDSPSLLQGIVAIANGGSHGFALRSDGTVFPWGYDTYGQVSMMPPDLDRVVAIAAGSSFGLALRSDGTVVGWREGNFAMPDGLGEVVAIAGGWDHSLALRSDGTVVGWGWNHFGQSSPPEGLGDVVEISAGQATSFALRANGTVVAWGNNWVGQTNIPAGLRDVVSISAAMRNERPSLALTSDHLGIVRSPSAAMVVEVGTPVPLMAQVAKATHYQWYRNGESLSDQTWPWLRIAGSGMADSGIYQLLASSGTEGVLTAPTLLGIYERSVEGGGVVEVIGLEADRVRFMAKPDRGWKLDHWEGTLSGRQPSHEVQFTADRSWVSVKAVFVPAAPALVSEVGGGSFYDPETQVLRAVPQLDWAFDRWVGVPADVERSNPLRVEPAVGLAARAEFVPSVGSGRFRGGEVVGLTSTPVPAGLGRVRAVAPGIGHGLALRMDGTVVGWGANGDGQITIPADLGEAVAIAVGQAHSLALRSDGTVAAWGWNVHRQTSVPPGLRDVVAIAAGGTFSMALRSDGTVVAWGNNGGGQATVPVGLDQVVSIAAGTWTGFALRADGTVVGWGSDIFDQGTIPAGLSGVVGIAGGSSLSIALRSDGTVVGWGQGWSRENRLVAWAGLEDAVAITALRDIRLAMRSNGTVVGYGVPVVIGAGAVASGLQPTLALRTDQLGVIRSPAATTIVEEGSGFTLFAEVAGVSALQWYRDGMPLPGQTWPWLQITDPVLTEAGMYRLVSTDATEGVLLPASRVKVLPVGTPRILVNGREPFESERVGGEPRITMTTSFPNGQIFYTLDGSTPRLESLMYTGPFTLTNSAVLRAFVLNEDFTRQAWSEPLGIEVVPTFVLATTAGAGGRIDRLPSLDRYAQDEVVRVRAIANPGWQFVRWEEDLTGSFPERHVAMRRHKTVRAIFAPIPQHRLTAVGQGGAVSGGGIYFEGAEAIVNATPTVGWTFLGWSGDHRGLEPQFSWLVDGPASFEARFGTVLSTVATGPGRVVLEPDLPFYPYGSEVRVIPVPEAGHYLALWGIAGSGQPKSEWTLTVTKALPRISALFQSLPPDKAVLAVQATLGGRVEQPNLDGIYGLGTAVVLTAVPDPGHEFAGWSGDVTGPELSVNLMMDRSKTVRAEFVRIGSGNHPLTVTVIGSGTVRRVPDLGAYETGSLVELVAEPEARSVFGGWTGDVSGGQGRIRLLIEGPTVVEARFLDVHPVVTEVGGEGEILLSPPDGSYPEGTWVAATAKPAEGWGFVQWSGDLDTTRQETAFTVDAPKRVVANFARLGTLTTEVRGRGRIVRTPDADSYLPGSMVTLTAEAAEGWRFDRWSGGASGEESTLLVTGGRTEAVVAEFVDALAPVVTLAVPLAETVRDERFTLRGEVTDNDQVAGAGWAWNGVDQGPLLLGGGAFVVEGRNLLPGPNMLAVYAIDRAGNRGETTRVVIWEPVRTLRVSNATEVQEGGSVTFAVQLEAPAEVSGLTFRLEYDPRFLAEPEMEWGGLVEPGLATVNTSTNGQIWAAFALAGVVLPEGTNRLGNVRFRARSVPGVTNVALLPQVLSVSGTEGNPMYPGNAGVAGQVHIEPRRITGDNNANQRLDIGDALVIARLQVGLEEVRPWDVALNDLNGSQAIDNGDVVRVLRVVVGMNTPPGAGRVAALAVGEMVNTNDVVSLAFPDGTVVRAGEPWRVVLNVQRAFGELSGFSLRMSYPAGLTLISREGGELIPADASVIWNEETAGLQMAALRVTPWPMAGGEAAVLTFMPGSRPGSGGRIEVVSGEVSGDGFDVAGLDAVEATVTAENIAPELGEIDDQLVTENETLTLQLEGSDAETPEALTYGVVSAPAGLEVTVTGLLRWTPTEEQGPSTNMVTVRVSDGELTAERVFLVVVLERVLPEPPMINPPSIGDDGALSLEIYAEVGAEIVLETSIDLGGWIEEQTLIGRGRDIPVGVALILDTAPTARFWRVRRK